MMRRARLASLLAIGLAVAAATCSDEPRGDDDDADGSGATGPGLFCQPGATEACYEGPDGSEGVGECRAGVRTCAADGASFGPCEGQALPAAEVCGDAVDEDCDGAAASVVR